MSCVLCGGEAAEKPDPRMPLLQVETCVPCRDRLAADLGWTRTSGNGRLAHGPRTWFRRGQIVEVPA